MLEDSPRNVGKGSLLQMGPVVQTSVTAFED
jgi:hypothetical protein